MVVSNNEFYIWLERVKLKYEVEVVFTLFRDSSIEV